MTGNAGKVDDRGNVWLDARQIPIPSHLSPQARTFLCSQPQERRPYPMPQDVAAWNALVESFNRFYVESMQPTLREVKIRVEETALGGVATYVGSPSSPTASAKAKVVLYLHGGALVFCGGPAVAVDAALAVVRTGRLSFAVDYGMPPEKPYPRGLDDCVAAYCALLDTYPADRIVICGRSAGGNLAAATVLKLRDAGLPLPAAVVLLTPELDLTESGDSFQTLQGIDVVLKAGLPEANALYAAGHQLTHPYISPLFGDFGTGFPPTFIQAGTRDLFLSNAVRMHRALREAGVRAELHIWDAMPHGGFGGGTPEDEEVCRELKVFLGALERED